MCLPSLQYRHELEEMGSVVSLIIKAEVESHLGKGFSGQRLSTVCVCSYVCRYTCVSMHVVTRGQP